MSSPPSSFPRCVVCRKKLVVPIFCACGVPLCLTHRYAQFHYCQTLKDIDEQQRLHVQQEAMAVTRMKFPDAL